MLKFKKIFTVLFVIISLIISNTIVLAQTEIAQEEGNVDSRFINDANKLIETIPENILKEFEEEGWEFFVTDTNLADRFYKGVFPSVQGVTDYDNHKIYVEDRDAAIQGATIHEFGHFVDNSRGTITSTVEFRNIFNSEADDFKNTFNVNYHFDIVEFFAEGFSIYVNGDKEALKKSCPELFQTLETTVKTEKESENNEKK